MFFLCVLSAIDGKVITWIESKATFGDEETHQNYVKDQLTSYYNRCVAHHIYIYEYQCIPKSQNKNIR